MNNIRQLTKDEYPKAIELSWQVFTITGKEDFNNEGLEFFKSFIYNKKCINEIIFYGSFDNVFRSVEQPKITRNIQA